MMDVRQPACRNRNGMMVYIFTYNQYLKPNIVDHMESMAERRLCDTSYHGEKQNWSFERYVSVHKEQHHILQIFQEHRYKGTE